jgi:CDP-paratose 2-epimerase
VGYSVAALAALKVNVTQGAYRPFPQKMSGFSVAGITEEFSTAAPLSLYGAAKRASEQLAIEYGR